MLCAVLVFLSSLSVPVFAEEDSNTVSFSRLASAAAGFMSDAVAHQNWKLDGDSVDAAAQHFRAAVLGGASEIKPGVAGGFLGYPMKENCEGVTWDWLAATDTSSSVTYSYESLRQIGTASDRDSMVAIRSDNPMTVYAYFGRIMANLGLDSYGTDSASFLRMIGGWFMTLLYNILNFTNVLFHKTIQALQFLNPFSWLGKLAVGVLPIDTGIPSGPSAVLNPDGTTTNVTEINLDGIGALFTYLSQNWSWGLVIPLLTAILAATLLLKRSANKGSEVAKFVWRVFSITLLVALLGGTYTSMLGFLESSFGGSGRLPAATRIMMTTYFDFQTWCEQTHMSLPSGVYLSSDGDANVTDGTLRGTRRTALQLNKYALQCKIAGSVSGGSAAGASAGWIDSTGDALADFNQSTLDWNASVRNADMDFSVEGARWVSDMLSRYRSGAKYNASDWEAYYKAAYLDFSNSDAEGTGNEDSAGRSLSNIIQHTDDALDWRKLDDKDTTPGKQMVVGNGTASFQIGGKDYFYDNSTNPWTTRRGYGVDASTGAAGPDNGTGSIGTSVTFGDRTTVNIVGTGVNSQLSPMAIYNYLNSRFTDTGITVYDPTTSTSRYVKQSHYAVSSVGPSVLGLIYFLDAVILMGMLIFICLNYCCSIIWAALRRTVQIVMSVPIVMLGSLRFTAKLIYHTAMLLIEVVLTLLIYGVVQELAISFMDLSDTLFGGAMNGISDPGQLLTGTQLLSVNAGTILMGGASLPAAAVFEGFVLEIVTSLVVMVLYIVFGVVMVRYRGVFVKSVDEMVGDVLTSFVPGARGGDLKMPDAKLGGAPGKVAGAVGEGLGFGLAAKRAVGPQDEPDADAYDDGDAQEARAASEGEGADGADGDAAETVVREEAGAGLGNDKAEQQDINVAAQVEANGLDGNGGEGGFGIENDSEEREELRGGGADVSFEDGEDDTDRSGFHVLETNETGEDGREKGNESGNEARSDGKGEDRREERDAGPGRDGAYGTDPAQVADLLDSLEAASGEDREDPRETDDADGKDDRAEYDGLREAREGDVPDPGEPMDLNDEDMRSITDLLNSMDRNADMDRVDAEDLKAEARDTREAAEEAVQRSDPEAVPGMNETAKDLMVGSLIAGSLTASQLIADAAVAGAEAAAAGALREDEKDEIGRRAARELDPDAQARHAAEEAALQAVRDDGQEPTADQEERIRAMAGAAYDRNKAAEKDRTADAAADAAVAAASVGRELSAEDEDNAAEAGRRAAEKRIANASEDRLAWSSSVKGAAEAAGGDPVSKEEERKAVKDGKAAAKAYMAKAEEAAEAMNGGRRLTQEERDAVREQAKAGMASVAAVAAAESIREQRGGKALTQEERDKVGAAAAEDASRKMEAATPEAVARAAVKEGVKAVDPKAKPGKAEWKAGMEAARGRMEESAAGQAAAEASVDATNMVRTENGEARMTRGEAARTAKQAAKRAEDGAPDMLELSKQAGAQGAMEVRAEGKAKPGMTEKETAMAGAAAGAAATAGHAAAASSKPGPAWNAGPGQPDGSGGSRMVDRSGASGSDPDYPGSPAGPDSLGASPGPDDGRMTARRTRDGMRRMLDNALDLKEHSDGRFMASDGTVRRCSTGEEGARAVRQQSVRTARLLQDSLDKAPKSEKRAAAVAKDMVSEAADIKKEARRMQKKGDMAAAAELRDQASALERRAEAIAPGAMGRAAIGKARSQIVMGALLSQSENGILSAVGSGMKQGAYMSAYSAMFGGAAQAGSRQGGTQGAAQGGAGGASTMSEWRARAQAKNESMWGEGGTGISDETWTDRAAPEGAETLDRRTRIERRKIAKEAREETRRRADEVIRSRHRTEAVTEPDFRQPAEDPDGTGSDGLFAGWTERPRKARPEDLPDINDMD